MRYQLVFVMMKKKRIRFDTDEQVRHTLQLFFSVFKEQGSAYGVVHHFVQHNIQFPKRTNGDMWKGKLIWGRLSHSRAVSILKNPFYAGVYAYGQRTSQKKLSETGQLKTSTTTLSIDAWPIVIKDHHEKYISWEDYLDNQKKLKQNQTNKEENMIPLNAREGLALLQGLLICGECGHRLSTRYQGNKGIYPAYICHWKQREGIERTICLSVSGTALDQAISEKVLTTINSAQIEIAIKAFEELEYRSQSLEKQWRMKIERAEYEAKLANRRYEEVDPSNRLVASTLEKDWEEALTFLQHTRSQYAEYQEKNILTATKEQKNNILALAKDFPHLWNAPSTSAKDRKRILRLLIKDITVKKLRGENKTTLHIRWQGGALEDLEVPTPRSSYEKWKHSDEIINRVRELALTMTDQQITKKFKQEGLITNKGDSFTLHSIRGIRCKHKIASPTLLQGPEEFSITQVTQKFNVSHHVIRYWIERNVVTARRNGSKILVLLGPGKEAELKNIIENSTKIRIARSKSQIAAPGGAL